MQRTMKKAPYAWVVADLLWPQTSPGQAATQAGVPKSQKCVWFPRAVQEQSGGVPCMGVTTYFLGSVSVVCRGKLRCEPGAAMMAGEIG